MKLTTSLLSDDSQPADVLHLVAPGATLGHCSDNDVPLRHGDTPVGRVQAIIRSDGEYWLLENLSKVAAVRLNGRPLAPRQGAALACGDRICIGDHEVRVEGACVTEAADTEAAPTPVQTAEAAVPALAVTALQAEQASEAAAEQTTAAAIHAETANSATPAEDMDIFHDLLGGPGVLPVGGGEPASDTHPFDMQSATPRNHPDPLALLPQAHESPAPDAQTSVAPEMHLDHILSDSTPTTLDLREPLAAHRDHDINDVLASADQQNPAYASKA